MAKPRRATAEAFYDVFADFPVADQASALKILEQIHRLAVREQAKQIRPSAEAIAADAIRNYEINNPAQNAALLLDDEGHRGGGPKQ